MALRNDGHRIRASSRGTRNPQPGRDAAESMLLRDSSGRSARRDPGTEPRRTDTVASAYSSSRTPMQPEPYRGHWHCRGVLESRINITSAYGRMLHR